MALLDRVFHIKNLILIRPRKTDEFKIPYAAWLNNRYKKFWFFTASQIFGCGYKYCSCFLSPVGSSWNALRRLLSTSRRTADFPKTIFTQSFCLISCYSCTIYTCKCRLFCSICFLRYSAKNEKLCSFIAYSWIVAKDLTSSWNFKLSMVF